MVSTLDQNLLVLHERLRTQEHLISELGPNYVAQNESIGNLINSLTKIRHQQDAFLDVPGQIHQLQQTLQQMQIQMQHPQTVPIQQAPLKPLTQMLEEAKPPQDPKMFPATPRVFCGGYQENVVEWFDHVEHIFRAKGVTNDASRMTYLRLYLGGGGGFL
jgi:hypothetical protein